MRVALDSEEASCILRSQRGAYTRLAQSTLLAYNVSISVLYGPRKKTHFYATAGHHHITPTTSIAATRRPEPSLLVASLESDVSYQRAARRPLLEP